MRQPIHPIASPTHGVLPERAVGIGFVVLLHIVAIWALLSGLAMKIVKAIEPSDLTVVFHQKLEPPKPVPQPPKPTLPVLTTTDVTPLKPPVIIIERDPPPIKDSYLPPQPPTQPGPPNITATGIASTHTIPEYPALARRLNEQGSVMLRLTISPEGAVLAANVLRSSGFDDLDQTAVNWVLAHWKYHPAIQNGIAVTGTADATVKFDLKDAR